MTWFACYVTLRFGLNARNQGFEASLFHPDFGNEVVLGRIFIDPQRVRFVSDGFSDEIPAEQVEVTLERNGRRIYFSDPSRPELKIFTSDQSILANPLIRQCQPVWSQLAGAVGRRELSSRLRLTAYFVVACVLLTLTGSWVLGVMVRSVAKQVPPEWEQKFGDEEMAMVRKKFRFADDTNLTAHIATLAAPLIAVLPPQNRDLKFYVVDYDLPNAFALPGGHIVVTTALLDMVDRDRPEQLLGVLAHEMAHITQKHHVRKVLSAAGPVAVFGVFLQGHSALMNVLAGGSGLIVVQGFSKQYETEADSVGWDYLVAADIDPHGMIEVFEKLRSFQRNTPGLVTLPEVFEGHPALDKRIALLERKAKKLPATGYLQLDSIDWTGRKTR